MEDGVGCSAGVHHSLRAGVLAAHRRKEDVHALNEGESSPYIKDLPWTEVAQRLRERSRVGKKDSLRGAEDEDQTAGYSAVVSTGIDMRLWICERLHRSVRMVPQSRVKKLGCVCVLRLLKVPSYSVTVVDGDIFQAEPT